MVTTNWWLWLAAFFTVSIYTVAFADNNLFRFVESIFVGTSAGYMVTANWFNYIKPQLLNVQKGQYVLLIPFLIGLLVYTRYVRSIAWVSRISLAFTLGYGSGFILSKNFRPDFLTQVIATFRTLDTFNNWLLVFGVITSLTYFLFTVEQKGVVGYASKAGRWVMMIALGAAFGSTVMARVSLFLGRVQFLLTEWMFLVK
ncbi:MAG: hypothetical protein Q8P31_06580 [Bacillota bacterium]|nr:hypothetical protein [Bacillota bacterium]